MKLLVTIFPFALAGRVKYDSPLVEMSHRTSLMNHKSLIQAGHDILNNRISSPEELKECLKEFYSSVFECIPIQESHPFCDEGILLLI